MRLHVCLSICVAHSLHVLGVVVLYGCSYNVLYVVCGRPVCFNVFTKFNMLHMIVHVFPRWCR